MWLPSVLVDFNVAERVLFQAVNQILYRGFLGVDLESNVRVPADVTFLVGLGQRFRHNELGSVATIHKVALWRSEKRVNSG